MGLFSISCKPGGKEEGMRQPLIFGHSCVTEYEENLSGESKNKILNFFCYLSLLYQELQEPMFCLGF